MASLSITEFLARPLRVGSLTLRNRALLAPLAGVSDVPFRRICAELGAGFTSVEMLSAVAVRYRARRTADMMTRHADEDLLGVQVSGAEPADVAWAARFMEEHGFDLVDLNMGCPVRKIVGKGWGAALLKEPERIGAMVAATREAVRVPLTAKIRTGYLRGRINVEETAARIGAGGADLITIHGRTRADGYGDPVDHAAIRRGFEAARAAAPGDIVCVGNGNVLDRVAAAGMVEDTGCDAVMVSRGALGNPWIFRELTDPAFRQPTLEDWRSVVLRHIDYHGAHYGDTPLAAILLRKHLLWYLSGFRGVKRLRARGSVVESLADARSLVGELAGSLPPDTRRFASGSTQGADYDPKYEMDRKEDRGVGHEDAA